MTQSLRESVIRRLRAGQVEIVVATDVAARGLDVEQISHVINYDVPYDEESYVHRIGRTGRAGRSGVATLFVTPRERRMMRDIEKFTGSAIKPMKIPSRADVAAKRVSVFKESLRKNLEEGDLDLYVALVQQLVDEGGFDMSEVAAAAARAANGSRSLAPEAEIPYVEEPYREPRRERPKRREERGPARAARPSPFRDDAGQTRAPRPPQRSETGPSRETRPRKPTNDDEPKVRLSMALGTNDGIRPADVVGSIANEANVPGRDIGPIDIREEITIVTLPAKYADHVLAKLSRARFRGRAVNLKLAEEGGHVAETRAPERKEEHRPAPRRDFKPARPRGDERVSSSRPQRAEERPPKRFERNDKAPRRDAAPRAEETPRRAPAKSPFYAGFKKPGGKRTDTRGPKGKNRPR